MNDFPLPARDLLPHAAPMLCIDCLLCASETGATALVCLTPQHILLHEGRMAQAGFVELAAQTAGAMKGWWEKTRGSQPRKGFLAAVQDFVCAGTAREGDLLLVSVTVVAEVADICLIEASVSRRQKDADASLSGRACGNSGDLCSRNAPVCLGHASPAAPAVILAHGKLKVFSFDAPLPA